VSVGALMKGANTARQVVKECYRAMNDPSNEHFPLSPLSSPQQPNGVVSNAQLDDTNHSNAIKPTIYCLNSKRLTRFVDTVDIEHSPSQPSGSQDLISLYSLTPLSNAVARFDPITGQKNGMRKSYLGHIKDLPGKNIIKPDSIIRQLLKVPESEADTFVGPRNIRRLERETLEGFGVMPGLIPDVYPFGLD
jgi:hypothetical protein